MIVVDSSVWISYLRNEDTPHTRFLEATDDALILVGDVILLEVLRGARSDLQANRIEQELAEFEIVSMLDAGVAKRAAQLYRSLRASGITIRKTADLIIATYCIENGHELLHNDRDFNPFEQYLGLRAVRS